MEETNGQNIIAELPVTESTPITEDQVVPEVAPEIAPEVVETPVETPAPEETPTA